MTRLVAAVSCAALLSISGPWSLVHVHADDDHARTDHHHAPAAHRHRHDADIDHHHDDAAGPVWTAASDPGSHAVAYAYSCVTSIVRDVAASMPATIDVGPQPAARQERVSPRDDRVHGPPGLAFASLRAPPAVPA